MTFTDLNGNLDTAYTRNVAPTPTTVLAAAVAYLRRRDALDVADALGLEVEA